MNDKVLCPWCGSKMDEEEKRMGDLMAKKDYNITEITRLLLKMRDNCVQKVGEMYNDPERQEKYEALQAAIDLINNPSRLTEANQEVEKDV